MGIQWEAGPRLKFMTGDSAVEPADAPQILKCVFGGSGGK